MKYCPLCGKEYEEGETCTKDGAVLVRARPDSGLEVGSVLKGSYRIVEPIGQGGMAAVYRGVQMPLGRDVAIKVLLPSMQAAPSMIQRFFQEARLLCQMTHPNVVGIIDFGNTEDGLVYMVMEYLRGQTLSQVVPVGGLPTSRILVLMRQICSGIAVAHRAGLVHRDLKPENIFVVPSDHGPETAKILDFGIARAVDGDAAETRLTRTGLVMGTPGFLAPEQIGGASEADARSDIYALGAILYLVITGSRPYDGATPSAILIRQLQEPPKLDLGRLADRSLLADVVRRAMERNPDERFQTAEELLQALEEAISKEGTEMIPTQLLHAVLEREAGHSPVGQGQAGSPPSGTVPEPTAVTEVSPTPSHAPAPLPTTATLMVGELPTSTAAADPAGTGPMTFPPQLSTRFPKAVLGALGLLVVIFALGWALGWPDRSGDADGDGSVSARGAAGGASVDDAAGTGKDPGGAGGSAGGSAGAVRGVDAERVLVGMSAAFSGSAKELGRGMRLGIDTCLKEAEEAGGVQGRKVELVALDDGYEPSRTVANMVELLLGRGVFGILGNVGTPTAEVAVPLARERQAPFVGAFTGADLLRPSPPDRYVFNYRASYVEETAALVRYLLDVRGFEPSEIAVFAQDDGFGDAGYRGVASTLEARGHGESVPRLGYRRNRVEVDDAVEALLRNHPQVKAVVLVATYRAASEFIHRLVDRKADLVFAGLSFIGSRALAEQLGELGPGYAEGVIVSQVVPHYDADLPGVERYRQSLQTYFPSEQPGFVSLEGYLACRIFVEGLERAGPSPTVDGFVDALESITELDLGIGEPLRFGPDRHQASDRVWGTVLDASARYRELDLDP